jgi:hypothetical protein
MGCRWPVALRQVVGTDSTRLMMCDMMPESP